MLHVAMLRGCDAAMWHRMAKFKIAEQQVL
jgi:hypothetical protein